MSNSKAFKEYLDKRCDNNFGLKRNSEFITLVRNEWKSMSESERNPYRVESIARKSPKTNEPTLEQNDNRMDEVLQQKLIDLVINNKSKEELISTKFYLMSTNIVCIIDKTYPPIEIGFVEYSIEKGIQTSYHRFTDAGKVAIGYTYRAKNHSETSHQIPFENFILASNDFCLIVEEIQDLIADSRHNNELSLELNPMIVFSNEEQVAQNAGALKWLFSKYKKEMKKKGKEINTEWDIKVLDVTYLLFNLFLKMGISRPMALCRSDVTQVGFDYSPNTDCPYHTNLGCIECAIGVVKRLSYMMSHTFQRTFALEITAQHFPKVDPKPTLVEEVQIEENFPPIVENHENLNELAEEVSGLSVSDDNKPKFFGIGRGKRGIRSKS